MGRIPECQLPIGPFPPAWQNPGVEPARRMPPVVILFLVYAFAMLAVVGLTLPLVISEAVEAPVSLSGIIDMLLLAYLIFTITMVLQRKQAGYALALGLASVGLTLIFLPPEGGALLILVGPLRWPAFIVAIILILGLRRPSARTWFSEP